MEVKFTLYSMDICNPCQEFKKNTRRIIEKIGILGYEWEEKKLSPAEATKIGGVPQLWLNNMKIIDGNPPENIIKRNILMGLKIIFMGEARKST